MTKPKELNKRFGQLAKKLLSPPGDTLKETLEEYGMSQKELAERTGLQKETVNRIIMGENPITHKTAQELERVLGIPANFWLERERKYRAELFSIQEKEELEKTYDWVKNFPQKELKQLGFLPDTRRKPELAEALLKFFGVASPKEWENIYLKNEQTVAFRLSLAHQDHPEAVSAWLRAGEKEMEKSELADFDKERFQEALEEARELAYQQPTDHFERLQELCSQAGVALIMTPKFPKAPISGATRWFHKHPLIQMTDRYKTNDQWWFTFFHEAGHILKHGKKEVFLENGDGDQEHEKKEKEADDFAEKFLFPSQYLKRLEKDGLSKAAILKIAEEARIHPGIVVGQLQHKELIPFSKWNGLKVRVF